MTTPANNPRHIEDFTVVAVGSGESLEVIGASIPEDQLQHLLSSCAGVLYARDQDGRLIELSLDMDFESLVAVEAKEQGDD